MQNVFKPTLLVCTKLHHTCHRLNVSSNDRQHGLFNESSNGFAHSNRANARILFRGASRQAKKALVLLGSKYYTAFTLAPLNRIGPARFSRFVGVRIPNRAGLRLHYTG